MVAGHAENIVAVMEDPPVAAASPVFRQAWMKIDGTFLGAVKNIARKR